MNAKEFVVQLQHIAPDAAALLRCDYEAEEADEYRQCFICRRRDAPLQIASDNDSMQELLCGWDLSTVEIGPIRFLTQPEYVAGEAVIIGTLDGDRLAYRSDRGDYVVLDWTTLSVSCLAARSGSALLDGLVMIAGYYAKSAIGEIDIEDLDVGADVKAKCLQAFGGTEFEAFCTSLLGI